MYSNVDGMQFKQIKSELQITWLHLSLKEEKYQNHTWADELSNLTQLNEQDHQISKWHCGGSAQWIYKFTTIGKLSQNTIYDWN
jgi:hypothetical protein